MGALAQEMRNDQGKGREQLDAELSRLHQEQAHLLAYMFILFVSGLMNFFEVDQPFNRLLGILTTGGVVMNGVLLWDVRRKITGVYREANGADQKMDDLSRT